MLENINSYDRLQALIRIQRFFDDIAEIKKESSEERKELLNMVFLAKYDMPFILVEDLKKSKQIPVKTLEHIKKFFDYSVMVIPAWEQLEAVYSGLYDEEIMGWPRDDLEKYADTLSEGKYLTIDVDLSKKKLEILKDVKEVIDEWKPHCKKTKDKPLTLPIWKVYDSYNQEPITFIDIARKLSRRFGRPEDDPILASYKKNVRTAYYKAKKIIDTIEAKIKEIDIWLKNRADDIQSVAYKKHVRMSYYKFKLIANKFVAKTKELDIRFKKTKKKTFKELP